MAKGERYKKFNNLQSKIRIEDVINRPLTKEDELNPEIQKLKVSILKTNMKYGVDSITHRELEGYKVSMGFELETCSGRVDEEDYKDLNVKSVFDGSLRDEEGNDPEGSEYVTGVLYGDSGFKQLYELCKVLNNNCDIDYRAGVHVHLGGLNWTKEDIVYCYILAKQLENEMFSMLPASRRKNKYCKPLAALFTSTVINKLISAKSRKLEYEVFIDQLYNEIFKYASGGHLPDQTVNTNTNHPRGSKCGYDINSQRYCWLNFVTLLFNTKGSPNSYTLEVRSHSATLNYKKIRNWTKIWAGFTKFITERKEDILKGRVTIKGEQCPINLETISLWAYPKSGDALVDYIRTRKELFTTSDERPEWVTTNEPVRSLKQVLEIN